MTTARLRKAVRLGFLIYVTVILIAAIVFLVCKSSSLIVTFDCFSLLVGWFGWLCCVAANIVLDWQQTSLSKKVRAARLQNESAPQKNFNLIRK